MDIRRWCHYSRCGICDLFLWQTEWPQLASQRWVHTTQMNGVSPDNRTQNVCVWGGLSFSYYVLEQRDLNIIICSQTVSGQSIYICPYTFHSFSSIPLEEARDFPNRDRARRSDSWRHDSDRWLTFKRQHLNELEFPDNQPDRSNYTPTLCSLLYYNTRWSYLRF